MYKLLNLIITTAILILAFSPVFSQIDENVFREDTGGFFQLVTAGQLSVMGLSIN